MSILNATSVYPPSETCESTRKRRREDDNATIELDRKPFTVRPEASDPFAKPRVFTPVSLVSRANLPLAYLDTGHSGSRLFSSIVPVLEACHEHDLPTTVLVAEEQAEKRLYAIERAKRQTYALCRLGAWVTRESIEVMPATVITSDEPRPKRQAMQPAGSGQPWWTSAVAETSMRSSHPAPNTVGLMKLSMLAGSSETHRTSLQDAHASAEFKQTADQMRDGKQQADQSITTFPSTAEEHFQDLAKQYLEALYLSRTSLAYFTKGPLSRIRAAFLNPIESGLLLPELIAFLREAILSSAVTDKKYREGIAGVVKDLPADALASPEQAVKPKSKRKWKSKRDKHGLFSTEKEYVGQWWTTEILTGTVASSAEAPTTTLQRRTPGLRSRETYLQIILALEVLALEATQIQTLTKQDNAEVSQDQDLQGKAYGGNTTKVKKAQDLAGLLGTLVDKLCIWHSLDTHSPLNEADGKSGESESIENDELRSFCIEVIIPFYMPRAPQHAAMVNKKLGGPSAPSPGKRKPGTRRPGEPSVRQPPEKKPRNPLVRVSTDTFSQNVKRVPSLHRSATDSGVVQHVKRESSETPMDSIPPLKHPAPAPRQRTSLMHSASFSKREVDFSAMSQANRTRLRQKAEVDEKLKEVITAIKKPNRALAVKEVAENTDLSFAKATAKGRPTLSRAKSSQGMHVAATPKYGRAIKATPDTRVKAAHPQGSGRSSGTSVVPSTSARITAQVSDIPHSSFAVPQTGHRARHGAANIEDTPSRGFAKFMPMGLKHSPGTLHSPTASRHATAVEQTPSKPVRSISMAPLVSTSSNNIRSLNVPQDGEKGDHESGETIYDALGWDDEYETLA